MNFFLKVESRKWKEKKRKVKIIEKGYNEGDYVIVQGGIIISKVDKKSITIIAPLVQINKKKPKIEK